MYAQGSSYVDYCDVYHGVNDRGNEFLSVGNAYGYKNKDRTGRIESYYFKNEQGEAFFRKKDFGFYENADGERTYLFPERKAVKNAVSRSSTEAMNDGVNQSSWQPLAAVNSIKGAHVKEGNTTRYDYGHFGYKYRNKDEKGNLKSTYYNDGCGQVFYSDIEKGYKFYENKRTGEKTYNFIDQPQSKEYKDYVQKRLQQL